ncbi:uncharacterized protein [Rhodnius prolixus]|uniref:uncharacterized protein n=1 Tax=Rhodnius prolixus TaxID=13249 RepID=UPI003D18D116
MNYIYCVIIITGVNFHVKAISHKNIKMEKIIIAGENDWLGEVPQEMISKEEMKYYKIEPNSKNIIGLHEILSRYNFYKNSKPTDKTKKKWKINFRKNDYASNKIVFDLSINHKKREASKNVDNLENEFNETQPIAKERTLTGGNNGEYEYNYDTFKDEYYEKTSVSDNKTLIVKPETEEKKVKEAIKKITDISPPTKCTDEERNNFGIKSIECVFRDLRNNGMDKNVINRIKQIILFWTVVYLFIVIPLWLIKGWCCCCCPFKFCKPYQVIYNVKSYIVRNPPGVLEKPNGEIVHYEPIPEEIDTFRSLELNVFKFR